MPPSLAVMITNLQIVDSLFLVTQFTCTNVYIGPISREADFPL